MEERAAYVAALDLGGGEGEAAARSFLADIIGTLQLPAPWVLTRDEEGRPFFADAVTCATSWEHPMEPLLRQLAEAARTLLALPPAERYSKVLALHGAWSEEAEAELEKWHCVEEDGSRPYYFQSETGVTTFEEPHSVVMPAYRFRLDSIARLSDEGYVSRLHTVASAAIGAGAQETAQLQAQSLGGREDVRATSSTAAAPATRVDQASGTTAADTSSGASSPDKAKAADVSGSKASKSSWTLEERREYIASLGIFELPSEERLSDLLADVIGASELPALWVFSRTRRGRPFFANHALRVSSWKHPLEEVIVDLASACRDCLALEGEDGAALARSLAARWGEEAEAEAARWVATSDASGQTVYCDAQTGEQRQDSPLEALLPACRMRLDAMGRLEQECRLAPSGGSAASTAPAPAREAEAEGATATAPAAPAGLKADAVPLAVSAAPASPPREGATATASSPGAAVEAGGGEPPASPAATASTQVVWTAAERATYVASLDLPRYPGEEVCRRLLGEALGEVPLPRPWVMTRHRRGMLFFVNEATGTTSWRHPLEDAMVQLAGVCRECFALASPEREAHVRALHAAWTAEFQRALAQWVGATGEGGRPYYYHRETGEVMHEDPTAAVWPEYQLRLCVISRLVDEECLAPAASSPARAELVAWSAASGRASEDAGPPADAGAAEASQELAVQKVSTAPAEPESSTSKRLASAARRRGTSILSMATAVASLLRPGSPATSSRSVGRLSSAGSAREPPAVAGSPGRAADSAPAAAAAQRAGVAGEAEEGSRSPKDAWSLEERRIYVESLGITPPFEAAVQHFLEDVFGEVPVPEPWALTRTRRGKPFFANKTSRESSWKHPLEAEVLGLADLCRDCLALGPAERARRVEELQKAWTDEAQEALSKWGCSVDEGDRVYYYNTETGQSTFEAPSAALLQPFQWRLDVASWLADEEYFAGLRAEEETQKSEEAAYVAQEQALAEAEALASQESEAGTASESPKGQAGSRPPTDCERQGELDEGAAAAEGSAVERAAAAAPPGLGSAAAGEEAWTLRQRRTYVLSLGKLKVPAEEALLDILADAIGTPALPWPWALTRNRRGSVFFGNKLTRASTWRHPLEPVLVRLLPLCRECLALPPETRGPRLEQLSGEWTGEAEATLNKWCSHADENGKAYYQHSETKERMFERPAAVEWPAYQLRLDVLQRLRSAPQLRPSGSQTEAPSRRSEGAAASRPAPLADVAGGGDSAAPSPAGSQHSGGSALRHTWTLEERRSYVASLDLVKLPIEEQLHQILEDVLGSVALPVPWIVSRNRRGRPFFANKATRSTSWKHPLEPTLVELVPALRELLALPTAIGRAQGEALKAAWMAEAEGELAQWVRAVDDKGKQYYYHRDTREKMYEEPQATLGPAHRLRLDALARIIGEEEASSTEGSSTAPEAVESPTTAASPTGGGSEDSHDGHSPSGGASGPRSRSGSGASEAPEELAQRARLATPVRVLHSAEDEQAYAAHLGLRLDKPGGRDHAVFGLLAPALALGLPVSWEARREGGRAKFVQPGFEPPLESWDHPLQPLHLELVQALRRLCGEGRPEAREAVAQLGALVGRVAGHAGRHSAWAAVRKAPAAEGASGEDLLVYEDPKSGLRRHDDPRLAVASQVGLELMTLKEVWRQTIELGHEASEAFPLSDDEAWLVAGQLAATVLRESPAAEAEVMSFVTSPQSSLAGSKSPKAIGSLKQCKAEQGPLTASTTAPSGSCRTEPFTAAQSWRSGGSSSREPLGPSLSLRSQGEEPAGPSLGVQPQGEADSSSASAAAGAGAPPDHAPEGEGSSHTAEVVEEELEEDAAADLGVQARRRSLGRSAGAAFASQAELETYVRQFGLKLGCSPGVDGEILAAVAPGLLLDAPIPWEARRDEAGLSFMHPGFEPPVRQQEHPLQALHSEMIQVFRGVASIRNRVHAGDICPRLARLVRRMAGQSSLSSFGTWEADSSGGFVDTASGRRRNDDPRLAAASQVGLSLTTIQAAWDQVSSTSPSGVDAFPFSKEEVWAIARELATSVLWEPPQPESKQTEEEADGRPEEPKQTEPLEEVAAVSSQEPERAAPPEELATASVQEPERAAPREEPAAASAQELQPAEPPDELAAAAIEEPQSAQPRRQQPPPSSPARSLLGAAAALLQEPQSAQPRQQQPLPSLPARSWRGAAEAPPQDGGAEEPFAAGAEPARGGEDSDYDALAGMPEESLPAHPWEQEAVAPSPAHSACSAATSPVKEPWRAQPPGLPALASSPAHSCCGRPPSPAKELHMAKGSTRPSAASSPAASPHSAAASPARPRRRQLLEEPPVLQPLELPACASSPARSSSSVESQKQFRTSAMEGTAADPPTSPEPNLAPHRSPLSRSFERMVRHSCSSLLEDEPQRSDLATADYGLFLRQEPTLDTYAAEKEDESCASIQPMRLNLTCVTNSEHAFDEEREHSKEEPDEPEGVHSAAGVPFESLYAEEDILEDDAPEDEQSSVEDGFLELPVARTAASSQRPQSAAPWRPQSAAPVPAIVVSAPERISPAAPEAHPGQCEGDLRPAAPEGAGGAPAAPVEDLPWPTHLARCGTGLTLPRSQAQLRLPLRQESASQLSGSVSPWGDLEAEGLSPGVPLSASPTAGSSSEADVPSLQRRDAGSQSAAWPQEAQESPLLLCNTGCQTSARLQEAPPSPDARRECASQTTFRRREEEPLPPAGPPPAMPLSPASAVSLTPSHRELPAPGSPMRSAAGSRSPVRRPRSPSRLTPPLPLAAAAEARPAPPPLGRGLEAPPAFLLPAAPPPAARPPSGAGPLPPRLAEATLASPSSVAPLPEPSLPGEAARQLSPPAPPTQQAPASPPSPAPLPLASPAGEAAPQPLPPAPPTLETPAAPSSPAPLPDPSLPGAVAPRLSPLESSAEVALALPSSPVPLPRPPPADEVAPTVWPPTPPTQSKPASPSSPVPLLEPFLISEAAAQPPPPPAPLARSVASSESTGAEDFHARVLRIRRDLDATRHSLQALCEHVDVAEESGEAEPEVEEVCASPPAPPARDPSPSAIAPAESEAGAEEEPEEDFRAHLLRISRDMDATRQSLRDFGPGDADVLAEESSAALLPSRLGPLGSACCRQEDSLAAPASQPELPQSSFCRQEEASPGTPSLQRQPPQSSSGQQEEEPPRVEPPRAEPPPPPAGRWPASPLRQEPDLRTVMLSSTPSRQPGCEDFLERVAALRLQCDALLGGAAAEAPEGQLGGHRLYEMAASLDALREKLGKVGVGSPERADAGMAVQEILQAALWADDLASTKQDFDIVTNEPCSPVLRKRDLAAGRTDLEQTPVPAMPEEAAMGMTELREQPPAPASPKELESVKAKLVEHPSVPTKPKESGSKWLQSAMQAQDDVVRAILAASEIKLLREQGESIRRQTHAVEAKTKELSRYQKGNKLRRVRDNGGEDAERELKAALVLQAKLTDTRGQLMSLRGNLKKELGQLSLSFGEALQQRKQLRGAEAQAE